MAKIVVTHPLEIPTEQKSRLEKLGDVTYHDTAAQAPEEWLDRTKGFDIVCSGRNGLRDKWDQLHDVFVSAPFVNITWADPEVLKANNVTIANAPGCNRHAVSEWVVTMMLLMARQLDKYLRATDLPDNAIRTPAISLAYKKVTVLGKGNIGTRVGEIAAALEMSVTYFGRGDDLNECVKDADIVVDALGSNSSTKHLLNRHFFDSLKDGALFISVTGEDIVDLDAMLAALDSGKLAYAAHDAGGSPVGDTNDPIYKKLLAHPKMYVTPHIGFNTDVERKISSTMMVDNVEAWLKGKPINAIGANVSR